MKNQKLHEILIKLNGSFSFMEGSAVVCADGLMLASELPTQIDEMNLGSVAAAFLSLGVRTDKEVNKNGFKQVVINNKDGDVIMMCVNEEIILLAITNEDINLSKLINVMQDITHDIESIIEY